MSAIEPTPFEIPAMETHYQQADPHYTIPSVLGPDGGSHTPTVVQQPETLSKSCRNLGRRASMEELLPSKRRHARSKENVEETEKFIEIWGKPEQRAEVLLNKGEGGACDKKKCASNRESLMKMYSDVERLEKQKQEAEEQLEREQLSRRKELEQIRAEHKEEIAQVREENNKLKVEVQKKESERKDALEERDRAKQLMRCKEMESDWCRKEHENLRQICEDIKSQSNGWRTTEEYTRDTNAKMVTVQRELKSFFEKMDQTTTLEEKLKAAQQQCLAYEEQAVIHGKEIARLQDLLQLEQSRAAWLESQVAALWQHLQQEQLNNSTRCLRQASECDKVYKKTDKRETSKAEKQKSEELERLKKSAKTLQDEKNKLSEKLRETSKAEKQKNEELERLKKSVKTLQDEKNNLSEKLRETSKAEKQKNEELERLRKSAKTLQDEKNGLSERLRDVLESPECQRPHCRQLEQKIREQQKAIQMVSPMNDMSRQYDGEHDQLKREYDELMTNPDGILGQLEKEFDDPFDAKVVLGGIFMAAYEESKKHMIEFVATNLKELFKVQPEPDEEGGGSNEIAMDDLSRAFGLLLHSTAAKSRLTCSTVIPKISGKIKCRIPKLAPCKRTKKKMPGLPVEQVVELTWKFVTLPNPMIVCQPETFSPDIHSKEFEHWNPKLVKPYHLTYARPVVYRSYHGLVASKGLVGNECGTPV